MKSKTVKIYAKDVLYVDEKHGAYIMYCRLRAARRGQGQGRGFWFFFYERISYLSFVVKADNCNVM